MQPLLYSNSAQKSSKPFWRRIFTSNSSMNAILKRNTIPEYPWLAFFILSSEMKQKNIQVLWYKMQGEMVKQNDASPCSCLKVLFLFLFKYLFKTYLQCPFKTAIYAFMKNQRLQ